MDAIQGETVHTTTRMDADSVLDTSESPVTTSAIEERLIGTYIHPLPLPTAGNGQDATPPDGELASDLGIAAFGLGFYPKFTPDDIYYTVHVEHLKYPLYQREKRMCLRNTSDYPPGIGRRGDFRPCRTYMRTEGEYFERHP